MKRLTTILLSAACLAFGMAAASAQDKYPSKPITIVVPYAPGGATDTVARLLGDELHGILGQPIVVENKPGAFGIIAIEGMANAKPDGYTLMLGNVTTNAITPLLYKSKLKINYEKDVTMVTRLVDVPAFVVVTPTNFPVNNMKELVAYAKAHNGKIRYGTVGIGSYPHFDAALLAHAFGVNMVNVPNKAGASGVIKDMLTGDVQLAFLNVSSTGPLIKAGKLKAIALVNDKRLSDYPDVPTMAEVGYPDIGTLAWQGLFAPGATPKPVLAALFKAVNEALNKPALADKFHKRHFRVVPNKSSEDAQAWLKTEIAHWKKAVVDSKITVGN
jgi:tripartite-type tricarboxylate transporter receptor subunit TctC